MSRIKFAVPLKKENRDYPSLSELLDLTAVDDGLETEQTQIINSETEDKVEKSNGKEKSSLKKKQNMKLGKPAQPKPELSSNPALTGIKLPKKPEKPNSGFFNFIRHHAPSLEADGVEDPFGKASKLWQQASLSVKDKYEYKYHKDKTKYLAAMVKYDEKVKALEEKAAAKKSKVNKLKESKSKVSSPSFLLPKNQYVVKTVKKPAEKTEQPEDESKNGSETVSNSEKVSYLRLPDKAVNCKDKDFNGNLHNDEVTSEKPCEESHNNEVTSVKAHNDDTSEDTFDDIETNENHDIDRNTDVSEKEDTSESLVGEEDTPKGETDLMKETVSVTIGKPKKIKLKNIRGRRFKKNALEINNLRGPESLIKILPVPDPVQEPDAVEPVDNEMSYEPTVCRCGKSFSSLFWYKSHIQKCLPTYKCDLCPKTFKVEKCLKKHRKQTHEERKTCEICGNGFTTGNQLLRHTKKVHEAEVICPKCGNVFKNNNSFKKHRKNVCMSDVEEDDYDITVNKGTKRPLVNYDIDTDSDTEETQQDNKQAKILLKCANCPKTYESSRGLRAHKKRHHNSPEANNTAEKIANIAVIDGITYVAMSSASLEGITIEFE